MKDVDLRNLIAFTETYKMLYLPYLKIYHPSVFTLLYGTKHLSRGIVNVYPYWDEQDAGLSEGYVFLVLREDLIKSDSEEFYNLINSDIIEEVWYETVNTMQYVILAVKIKIGIAEDFEKGNYSKLFRFSDLQRIWRIFQSDSGLLAHVPSGQGKAKLGVEYHILTKSQEYEKHIASQLNVQFDLFKNTLSELKSRLVDDMDDETLNLDLLTNQIQNNGNDD